MFPQKVDKLVLDGVANPHDYYSGLYVYTNNTPAKQGYLFFS
jgi:hypothetical protein